VDKKGVESMNKNLNPVWDLQKIFGGGSGSQAFADFLAGLEALIGEFSGKVEEADVPGEEAGASGAEGTARVAEIVGLIDVMQQIALKLREADSFVACLQAENQDDKLAVRLGAQIKSLSAAYSSGLTRLDDLLARLPEPQWAKLLASTGMAQIAFPLGERRELAKDKMPPQLEALAGDLAVDGYHAWSDLYNLAVSRVRIPFEQDGATVSLSAGQAANKLHSPDREVRQRLFGQWETAWADQADFCADALNRIAGFRLQLYRHRGWDSVLKEPLAINRMSTQTLEAMWSAIDSCKEPFIAYLQRKAKLLGLERLDWADVEAPLGKADKQYAYSEGAQLIVDQFRRFSPAMADFAEMALENRWIEAEDRPGKRPGGFCTSFPLSEETRIFMTYAGTASNVSTLAHELGHAYHQHVMNDLPALAQDYAMNVAETASTLAEMIVADATLKSATTEEERLALLEDKLQRSVAFYMNIRARFLFETSFYDERRRGIVSVERLNELMQSAQETAFGDSLSGYHPYFWASKLHFYITEVPFYNFPYTFGYLFSAGIYALAESEGAGSKFADRYVALLRDTGSMTVEQLAMKHLGVDLTSEAFWRQAMDPSLRDLQQFMALTEG
jgi:pepF/M3 family oligoendopeptidase